MAIQPKNDTAIKVDTITEKTTNNGVDIETVHLEDGAVSAVTTLDMTGALTTDTINENGAGNGVTIEGVKNIDSYFELSSISAPGTPAANKVRLYDASGDLIAKDSAGDTWNLTPGWSTWNPTYSANGSMTYTSVTTHVAQYLQMGSLVFFNLYAEGTTGGTASTTLRATLPVSAHVDMTSTCLATHGRDGTTGIDLTIASIDGNNDRIDFLLDGAATWSLGTGRIIKASGFYRAA